MNISIKDLLTLSDKNKYVVVSKIYYDDKDYLFLLDINDNSNFKFCYVDKNEVVESSNSDLNTKLLPLFFNKVKDILPNEN